MTASGDEKDAMKATWSPIPEGSFWNNYKSLLTLQALQTLIQKTLQTKVLVCIVILIHTICAK